MLMGTRYELDSRGPSNWHPSPALAVPFSVSCADSLFVVTLCLIKCDGEINACLLVPVSIMFLRAIDSLAPAETGRHFARGGARARRTGLTSLQC